MSRTKPYFNYSGRSSEQRWQRGVLEAFSQDNLTTRLNNPSVNKNAGKDSTTMSENQVNVDIDELVRLVGVEIPDGYRAVAYRYPKKGEKWFDHMWKNAPKPDSAIVTASADYPSSAGSEKAFIVEVVDPNSHPTERGKASKYPGWEVAEPKARRPLKGEYYWNIYSEKPLEASINFLSWDPKVFIMRKKEPTRFTEAQLQEIRRLALYSGSRSDEAIADTAARMIAELPGMVKNGR